LLLACGTATAQTTLSRTDGVLGSAVQYDLAGDNGELFIFVPSLTSGPTPLGILDGVDTRTMDVGIDLLSLLSSGALIGGQGQVLYPLPLDPTIAGLPLHAQFFTISGLTTTLADDLSNASSFVMAVPDSVQHTLGDSIQARQGHTATLLADGTVLILGGDEPDALGNLTPVDTAELFDPQTQSFTALSATMTHARSTHTATLLQDGRVLVAGGYDVTDTVRNTIEIYDPTAQSFTSGAAMTDARTQHTAVLLQDGKVFVSGGAGMFDLSDVLGSLLSVNKTAEIYDPTVDAWTSVPDVPITESGIIGQGASVLPNGQVLLTGGVPVAIFLGIPLPSITGKCHRFDPSTGNWVGTASLPKDRVYHAQLALSDGRTLVAGGADGDFVLQSFTTYGDCFTYDASSDSWTTVASMNHARAYGTLIERSGEILSLGGLGTVDITSGSGTPERWIESAGTSLTGWTDSAQTLLAREVARFVSVEGGARVLVVGTGDNLLPSVPDRTAEVYVP
jgi:hypothetical protein